MVFTCLELETRRRMLGLSQKDLGLCLALIVPKDGDPRPIPQTAVSKWEEGTPRHPEPPLWVQENMPRVLDVIAGVQDALDRRVESLVDDLEPDGDGLLTVPVYRGYHRFWSDVPKLDGWPYSMWNMAVMRALDSRGRDRFRLEMRR